MLMESLFVHIQTWSHVSRSMTSSSLRSSWVNWVTSVTIKRPVLLEHSNRRGWWSKTVCCNLLRKGVLALQHSHGSFVKISLIFVSLSPLGTRIGSFPSKQLPEFSGLLTLRHNLLRDFLADHRADFLCHSSLISTWALETSYLHLIFVNTIL